MAWLEIILILFGLVILGNAFTYWFQDFFVFWPKRLPNNHIFSFDAPFEEVWIQATDGAQLHALWFKSSTGISPRGVILYMHGNADNLDRWGKVYPFFLELGYDFFVYDYRGFGKSRGKKSEAAFHQDAMDMHTFLRAHYSENQIGLYGRSLGAAMASKLATQVSTPYLILETPFSSIPSLFYTYYPIFPRIFFFRFHFSNYASLPKVKAPIVIFQGTADRVVPYRNAVKLKEVLKPGDLFITLEGGKHRNSMEFEAYQEKMEKLLRE